MINVMIVDDHKMIREGLKRLLETDENNLATDYPLKWTFSGATKRDYIATVSEDGRSVTIECLSASEKPLKITATYNGVKASIKVNLVGY